MIMLIFLLTLISVIGIMIINQLGNQLKSTTNRYDDMQAKYISEAGIERTIKEACNQLNKIIKSQENSIENFYYNVNNSLSRSSNINNMQSELYHVKNCLNAISDKINIGDLSNINRKIDSIETADSMINNIDSIRDNILNLVIESNKYEEIKDKIYLAIEHLYKALNFAYIEKNKDVEPVPLKDSSSNNRNDAVYNGAEIRELVNGDSNKFGNSFNKIVGKLGEVTNTLFNQIRSVISWGNKEAEKIHDEGKKIYIDFEDNIRILMNGYYGILYNGNYENLSSSIIVAQLEKINISIEQKINEINKVQLELNKLYLNNVDKDISLKIAIDEVLKAYDNIKNDLRWLQKKLGLSALNSDSSPDPDPDPKPEQTPDSDKNENYTLKLQLENYNKEFDEFQNNNRSYKYEILYKEGQSILEKIKKDIIIKKDINNNIIKIEDIEVDIISNAYKKNTLSIYNLVYKIESKVIFKIDIQDNFKVKYEIKTYEKVPLK